MMPDRSMILDHCVSFVALEKASQELRAGATVRPAVVAECPIRTFMCSRAAPVGGKPSSLDPILRHRPRPP